MARPRTYDEATVVEDALQTFWKQGYEATSVGDLIAATRVDRGSLYLAFGSKRALYARAVGTYLRQGRVRLREVIAESGSASHRLERWLEQVAAGCSGANGGPGCLAVQAMIELSPHDAGLRRRLARHWALVAAAIEGLLREGQRDGDVRQDVAAAALARLVVRLMAGMAVFARHGERAPITQAVMALIRPPAARMSHPSTPPNHHHTHTRARARMAD